MPELKENLNPVTMTGLAWLLEHWNASGVPWDEPIQITDEPEDGGSDFRVDWDRRLSQRAKEDHPIPQLPATAEG